MTDQISNRTDPLPIRWAAAFVAMLVIGWTAVQFFGAQRFHNTPLWQRLRPVVLASPPQTVEHVEVRDRERGGFTVAQTERGVYFLSGAKHVPSAQEQVVVQANDHWELYLCALGGARCMTIHSFCAGATLSSVVRNEQGRVEGCYAPSLGERQRSQPEATAHPTAASGPGKKFRRMPPAVGTSHPRDWAWRMGLPVSPTASARRPEPDAPADEYPPRRSSHGP